MMLQYLRGIFVIMGIVALVILAAVFYFVFDLLYWAVVALIVIAAVITLPYFVGKKSEPDKKGNYEIKNIK